MNLSTLFLQTILTVAPPGYSKYSVTPVDCPVTSKENQTNTSDCADYKWSEFYNSYVRKETAEEGVERYKVIVDTLINTAKQKLCVDDDLKRIPNCEIEKQFRIWTFVDLVSIMGAAAIAESGLREDVEFGRGSSNTPSKDGGRGLGPALEVCIVQLHPISLKKFGRDPQDFLGPQNLGNCFDFGMELMTRSRNMCAYQAIKTPELKHNWVFETFSAYGTGYTCQSSNKGRTDYRTNIFNLLMSDFATRIKNEKKKQHAN